MSNCCVSCTGRFPISKNCSYFKYYCNISEHIKNADNNVLFNYSAEAVLILMFMVIHYLTDQIK